MFCESVLWRMLLCPDSEVGPTPCSEPEPPPGNGVWANAVEPASFPERSSRARSAMEAPGRDGASRIVPGGRGGASPQSRQTTPEVDIPWPSKPGGDAFLVPSSCKSICKNYSDLLIGGDQVLPLSASPPEDRGSPRLPSGPFLHSSEIPAPAESPPPGAAAPRRGDSSRWRAGSGKNRSFVLQAGQPLSNAQLNAYLEQKLLDLYRQHMAQSLVRQGSPSAALASEFILTSVDHISQQLSRQQNLEAAKAKDMVISCLLRVASGLPSSGEISTPQLQISDDLA